MYAIKWTTVIYLALGFVMLFVTAAASLLTSAHEEPIGVNFSSCGQLTKCHTHSIQAGDTLWAIARDINRRHYHGRKDTREILYEIRQINPGIDPGRLLAGHQINIPNIYADK